MITAIIVGLFIIGLLITYLLARKCTLGKFEMLAGEKVLYEEDGLRVYVLDAPTPIWISFWSPKNYKLRITDKRIIISQKMWLRSEYILRYVIYYNEPLEGGWLFSIYTAFVCTAKNIEVRQMKGAPSIRFTPDIEALQIKYVEIIPRNSSAIVRHLKP